MTPIPGQLEDSAMRDDHWNRCDVCGRFIPMHDFSEGRAVRRFLTPDSEFTREEYMTLCRDHADER